MPMEIESRKVVGLQIWWLLDELDCGSCIRYMVYMYINVVRYFCLGASAVINWEGSLTGWLWLCVANYHTVWLSCLIKGAAGLANPPMFILAIHCGKYMDTLKKQFGWILRFTLHAHFATIL